MTNVTPPGLVEGFEETINQLDAEVQQMARHWAKDCPDAWEDLAQEARLAIYLELKVNPAAPRSHLFQRAKHEILDYRKKGKSVDGKLHRTFKRPFVWPLVSLDAPGVLADNSSLYFRSHQLSPVEEVVLARWAHSVMRARLSETADQYLCLKLHGYSWREAEILLGLTLSQGQWLREEIKREAKDTFGEKGDGYV